MAVSYNGVVNIEIIRGDTLIKGYNITNEDDPAYNYAGTTVMFQVKADSEDSVAVLSATPTPDTATLGEMGIDIEIDGADTANVDPGEYVYDIQFNLPDGTIRTYVSGKVIVYADVSR